MSLGAPIMKRALEQHRDYRRALETAGLEVIELKAEAKYPDSTFVEDKAVLTTDWAVITRPGGR